MTTEERLRRYREFEVYVGWTDEDAARVGVAGRAVESALPALIDDFYARIESNPGAASVIQGGQAQIDRLKRSLLTWIRDLLKGLVNVEYVDHRWQVGWRHADIGLDAVYVHLALSRLRMGLSREVEQSPLIPDQDRLAVLRSLNTRLDLDLALIEDAYQTEHRARLQSSERLAAIGQVTGGVAHELRNPLNVVKTSVYYLLNARSPSSEKTAEHLARIERHVNLADSVIMALSNFARMPVPTTKTFDVAHLIRDVLADNAPPKGIDVTINIDPQVDDAVADRDQIGIVLANLVRNACDAMPNGGSLTLSAKRDLESGGLELSVEDTGVGISREDLTRIMEPLFSTKARGLGLGLAIARAITEKNRGRLKVESELGKGSLFLLQLPSPSSVEHEEVTRKGPKP